MKCDLCGGEMRKTSFSSFVCQSPDCPGCPTSRANVEARQAAVAKGDEFIEKDHEYLDDTR